MENLLKLNDLSLNNERLAAQTDTLKQSIRIGLRNIWEKTNENWGNHYPLTPKLEEEFYEFCLKQGK